MLRISLPAPSGNQDSGRVETCRGLPQRSKTVAEIEPPFRERALQAATARDAPSVSAYRRTLDSTIQQIRAVAWLRYG